MAGYTWTFDVASGVFKNNSISKKLRFAAIVNTVFQQFVKTEPGFGKKKGETHNIRRIKNIAVPTSAVLTENVRVPIDTFSTSQIAITVQEMGRGVEFTSLAQDLETFDLENGVQKQLRNQMKVVIDNAAAAAFKTTSVKVIAIPTGLSAITWEVSGTPGTPATVNLNYEHCGIIRDYMQDTMQVPFWEGNWYAGIASTKALRGIKADPNFQFWRQYLRPGDVLMNSEVGMIEQIRFVESNNTAALATKQSVLGEALIFGEDAVCMIESEPFELRAAIPADFGRQKAVAWVGQAAWSTVWDTAIAGEARIVRVSST